MAQASQNITLVGEHHLDCSHLVGVKNLVLDKLVTSDHVILALEEHRKNIPEFALEKVDSSKSKTEGMALRSSSVSTNSRKIDGLDFLKDERGGSYKAMLRELAEEVEKLEGKKITVIAVDSRKDSSRNDTNTKWDSRMRANLADALERHGEVGEVVFPVGSAHISDSKMPETKGRRLGELLLQNGINTQAVNLYASEKPVKAEVQLDIKGFERFREEFSVAPKKDKQLSVGATAATPNTQADVKAAGDAAMHALVNASREGNSVRSGSDAQERTRTVSERGSPPDARKEPKKVLPTM